MGTMTYMWMSEDDLQELDFGFYICVSWDGNRLGSKKLDPLTH